MSLIDKVNRTLLKTMGHTMVQLAPPKIRACHCREIMRRHKVGDILLRTYNWNLSSNLIPGRFSHSGIVTSEGNMYHAIGTGVETIDILDFIKDADNVCIMRPKDGVAFDISVAVKFAISEDRKPYDFKFEDGDPRHPGFEYCHKYVSFAYMLGGITCPMFTVGWWLWKKRAYTCDSFLQNSALKIVYEAAAKENP